jgi:polyisoprenoid-binding protein YceI
VNTTPAPARSKKRTILTVGGVFIVALVALAGFGIWYQFIRDDAPPPVSLDAAVSSVRGATPTDAATAADPATATATPATGQATTAASSAATAPADDPATPTTTSDPSDPAGLDGDWTVDDSQDSFVGYRVTENLARVGTTEAVGRTSDITGSATIDGTSVTAAAFEADLTTLTSDESMRDGQLGRQAIQTDQFPTATFTLTQPLELGSDLAAGAASQVVAHGDLTLHGVTQPVDITLDLQYTNGVIVAVGSLEIQFADFGIEQPTSMRVVSVEDHGMMELQLYFMPAS